MQHTGLDAGVADALPEQVSPVVFLGGPFTTGSRPGRPQLGEVIKRLTSLHGEEDAWETLLGPMGNAGFDPLKPGRVGISAGSGLAFFLVEGAAGFAAAVRSPKKWREAFRKATVRAPRPLKVKGAAEAEWGVLEEGWKVAYARRPPWLYAVAGFDKQKDAAALLADLVAVSPDDSLGAHPPFREAMDSGSVNGDLVLWMGADALSGLRPDTDLWTAAIERSSAVAGKAEDLMGAMIQMEDLALGLSAQPDRLRVEGLLCAHGTLMDAFDTMVGSGSQCVIGPRALEARYPVWALSVLDWSFFARTLPAVASVLDRITGSWGELFKLPGADQRSNGVAALAVCGLRPFSPDPESLADMDLLSFIDAFMVLEMLGQNLPGQIAGRFLDVMGDVMRDGLKRIRKTEEEQMTSVVLMGHRFFAALRRGAIILATSREALQEARNLLEVQSSETVPSGMIMSGQVDPGGISRLLPRDAGEEFLKGVKDKVMAEMLGIGSARVEVQRVSSGMRLVFQQEIKGQGS
jgi:hypothetical protein